MQSKLRYQFSIRRLLAMTGAVAMALTVVRRLGGPIYLQVGLGADFTLLVVWAFLRWPAVQANLREVRKRRLAILAKREVLAAEMAEKRRLHEAVPADRP